MVRKATSVHTMSMSACSHIRLLAVIRLGMKGPQCPHLKQGMNEHSFYPHLRNDCANRVLVGEIFQLDHVSWDKEEGHFITDMQHREKSHLLSAKQKSIFAEWNAEFS